MARRKTPSRGIESYTHEDEQRVNNPPVGLVTPRTEPRAEEKQAYVHDPHLDPEMSWAGKSEHTAFVVPTVSLHVHERIDPRTIIEAARKDRRESGQPSLFDLPEENPPLRRAIEFYRHRHNWTNRLIAGDSLLVMNSLIEKEGLGGHVQTIYFDPPYGIKYGSNFQPFLSRREVRDGRAEDLTAEPEQLRAFRDTWELGIHSYLTYLRDRVLLCRELLGETGSCFVQIGDENVNRVGVLMDEVFGPENRIAMITFAKTSGSRAATLPEVADYLLWYAKDRKQTKYRQLYEALTRREIIGLFSSYAMLELPDGRCRKLTPEERFDPDRHLPRDARIYRRDRLESQGISTTGRSEPFHWNGRIFHCYENSQWKVSAEGMRHLAELGRLDAGDGQLSLQWKRYEDEVPGRRIHNIWTSQSAVKDKRYVVQTARKVVQRCILMTSDPGDLVFDPTCGSGTTAFVAEQWGRRWISCDTSRVAIAIARQRLMTAHFDYYRLANPDQGIGAGLQYRHVDVVSAGTLAYDKPARRVHLYDQPMIDKGKKRVTGPFTIEAVPAPTVAHIALPFTPPQFALSRSGGTLRHADWREELLKTGIRGRQGHRLAFARLEPLPATRWLHADGETLAENDHRRAERVVVSFGPDHAPMEQQQVSLALEEAQVLFPTPSVIVFAAFQFDPEAAKDIDEINWRGGMLLKAQMNADLLTEDLKKKRASNESFWLVGQPEVELEAIREGKDSGRFRVSVLGFDYYNTRTGDLESGGKDQIALWMLDPDYDGRSLFPHQVFFPMTGGRDGWKKLARNLKSELDMDRIKAYHGTVSLPFDAGQYRRAAVKIVDDRGIESIKIVPIDG